MSILITGTAGFIGFHTVKKFIGDATPIIGLDNINSYYDVNLKHGRLRECGILPEEIEYNKIVSSGKYSNYRFIKLNLEDYENLDKLFRDCRIDTVIHLAAQAGVRYSCENPGAYIGSNIVGTFNILECCRRHQTRHLVFASSSSVYGLNHKMPFSCHDNTDHQISLYAATKKSNETMAHSYSYLYQIPITGLRFFTAYGEWGRPDMALFKFTGNILAGREIEIYNYGKVARDFTYVGDIVEGIRRVTERPPKGCSAWAGDAAGSPAPFQLYNIGRGHPATMAEFIDALEKAIGKKAIKKLLPPQPGDMENTWADVEAMRDDFDYRPGTELADGVARFVAWYRSFYGV